MATDNERPNWTDLAMVSGMEDGNGGQAARHWADHSDYGAAWKPPITETIERNHHEEMGVEFHYTVSGYYEVEAKCAKGAREEAEERFASEEAPAYIPIEGSGIHVFGISRVKDRDLFDRKPLK